MSSLAWSSLPWQLVSVLLVASACGSETRAPAPGGTGGSTSGADGTGGSDGPGEVGATGGLDGEEPSTSGGASDEPVCGDGTNPNSGGSLVLYTNDFESPNQPLQATCATLDQSGINTLYGSSNFRFQQVNTVEGVLVRDPEGHYMDPSGRGGSYAIGMLASVQDDLLALTFAFTGKSYINVGFDLSAIDVPGCGGPFGTAAPVMEVSLYDTVGSDFDFYARGKLLDRGTVVGVAPESDSTFTWEYGVVTLNATAAKGHSVTVLFDLQASGYAAFDNLSILAANAAGVVDRNNNGIPDNEECP